MTQHRQVKICWNPSTSVTNQNTTTLVNIFTCFWLCNVFCRCSYNCSQGFTLPGWLKNKPALRQVCKKYNNPMMRRWELKTTLMIRIFDVSCDEDTGEMKQGDNAMRCLSCHWIYIWAPFSPHWQSHYQSYTQCSNNTVLFVSGDIIENMLTKAQEHSFAIDPLKRTLDSIVSTKQQTLIRKMILSCFVLVCMGKCYNCVF